MGSPQRISDDPVQPCLLTPRVARLVGSWSKDSHLHLTPRNPTMAYYNYNAVPPPDNLQPNVAPSPTTPRNTVRQSNTGIDIDAWTISALQSLSVSPVARGTGTPLAIPIDERTRTTSRGEVRTVQFDNGTPSPPLPPRRPPSRRDSMVRREALLKGKEGSRQRRRWENGTISHENSATRACC